MAWFWSNATFEERRREAIRIAKNGDLDALAFLLLALLSMGSNSGIYDETTRFVRLVLEHIKAGCPSSIADNLSAMDSFKFDRTHWTSFVRERDYRWKKQM